MCRNFWMQFSKNAPSVDHSWVSKKDRTQDMKISTGNGNFSLQAIEFSPCPSEYCCWRGQCCELLTGTCDSGTFQCDYTTTTTTTVVTTTPDIIPDFGCSHHNPCPWGYCCELLTGACYSGYEEHECPFSKKSVEDFFLAH